MSLTNEQIVQKIDAYCHFEGIVLLPSQSAELVDYLQKFSYDEEQVHQEMVCEIRTLNGDYLFKKLIST